MNERRKIVIDVFLYLVVFLIAMVFGGLIALFPASLCASEPAELQFYTAMFASLIYSSVLVAVFVKTKWCPCSKAYISSQPWSVLALSALAAIFAMIPSAFLMEAAPESWQDFDGMEVFEVLVKNPWGYIVIGLFAPVVEEMVFRGAILRRIIFPVSSEEKPTKQVLWIGLIISSLCFAGVHGNLAQGPHAFFLGFLLGWMYYRTRSIIPGVVFHWVNNSIPYIMVPLFPDVPFDAKLAEYFNGDTTLLLISVVVSALLFAYVLSLLNRQMKQA